jgi:hypothetical protein
MRARAQTIKLSRGDVRALRILRNKRTARLAIHDDHGPVPLIHAQLSRHECVSLARALSLKR